MARKSLGVEDEQVLEVVSKDSSQPIYLCRGGGRGERRRGRGSGARARGEKRRKRGREEERKRKVERLTSLEAHEEVGDEYVDVS